MNKKLIISFLIFAVLLFNVNAIKNPSAVYCEEMGYEFTIESTDEGERGLCKLPDGTNVGAWDFLKGVVAQEFSYCNKQGYDLSIIADSEKCSSVFSYDCAVCVKENGEEVEVTRLMNLNFNEGICGDGFCTIDETRDSCSQDCPPSIADNKCDNVVDGICDPDCTKEEDFDCEAVPENEQQTQREDIGKGVDKKSNLPWIIGLSLLTITIVTVIFLHRRTRLQ